MVLFKDFRREVLFLAGDERPDFIDLDAARGDVADRRVLVGSAGAADVCQQAKDGALSHAGQPDVERTEQPSTSAEMTATRFAVLNLFMMNPSYQTALACQAESDGFSEKT